MAISVRNRLFVGSQYVLPQHTLSALMYRLTRSENRLWTDAMIRLFTKIYGVDLTEALHTDPKDYRNFNEFFTRAIKPDVRPVCNEEGAVVSPADGRISQIGTLTGKRMIQAKGKEFDLTTLLGGDAARSAPFAGGSFATIYLSPKDYHRLHMPVVGQLREMLYIPGRLFSVNEATAAAVPGLFARNERVATLFETSVGPMALVLVGAIFVASIETVWHGSVTPPPSAARRLQHWDYGTSGVWLKRGAEMGRFNMGSTVILVFGPGAVSWAASFQEGDPIRMGLRLGNTSR